MWLRTYLMVMACLVVSAVLYAGLLPNMVSSSDSIAVCVGLLIAINWPVFVVWFFYKRIRKLIKCVKSS